MSNIKTRNRKTQPLLTTQGRTREIVSTLERFVSDHPDASINLFRTSPVSIRIRVVADIFSKLSRGRRHELLWEYLKLANDEAASDISTLTPLSPQELKSSWVSMEFDEAARGKKLITLGKKR